MKWLKRFLWRQMQYCLWIGGLLLGGYVALMAFHQFWVGSILFFIAVIVAGGWIISFFDSETWTNGGGYDDEPRKSWGAPFEEQRRDFEEDMNRQQREDEDRGR